MVVVGRDDWQRLALTISVILAIAGGALLIFAGRAARDPSGLVSPAKPWLARTVPKGDFIAHIAALNGDEGAVVAKLLTWGGESLLRQLADAALRINFRITRVLRTGHEFHSQIVLSYNQKATLAQVRLETTSGSGETAGYFAELRDGEVTRMGIGSPDAESNAEQMMQVFDNLPIGIGDLQLQDALSIYESFQRKEFRPIGWLQGLGSQRLLVFELNFRCSQSTANKADGGAMDSPVALDVRGASALLYIAPLSASVRALRIFDAEDLLVRTYDGFVFDNLGGLFPIKSFRAGSIPDESHTIFQIESVILEPN
ncbi:MAG: hypothetical protein IH987_03975 [Planctomycetes bacterium]|nr:hypothetical protein [Planctomycetota bacterium]